MTAHNPVSEQDLEEAFKEDPDFGIRLLYEDYKEVILRYIKKQGRGLQLADWLDVFQQTMLEFWKKARSPDFDHRKPLALVFQIAQFRTWDALRRRKHMPNSDPDAILQHVAKDFRESEIGIQLQFPDGVDWEAFRQNLHEVIADLPEKQKIVARAYVDNYEHFRERDTYAPLADFVGNVTGKKESLVAVKSAWHEAKKKIVKDMARRGFKFIDTE